MGKNLSMKIPPPLPLRQQTKPFDDPDWIKHDGFREWVLLRFLGHVS